MDIFEKCYNFTRADETKAMGIYPYFHALNTRQDIEVVMEGKRRIMLGSNNYLGLTTCPEVIDAGIKAIEKYGTGCSGSRYLNGTLEMHLDLEAELADFLGRDDCLHHVFNRLPDKPRHHQRRRRARRLCRLRSGRTTPASMTAASLSYRENGPLQAFSDMEDLEHMSLQSIPEGGRQADRDGRRFQYGRRHRQAPRNRRAREKIRRAHDGRTMPTHSASSARADAVRQTIFGLDKDVDIVMSTFSKSLASLGGHMAGR